MSEFGDLIKQYRLNSVDPDKNGPLTQIKLGELIGDYLDIQGPTGGTISNWENGKTRLSHDDRDLLMALIVTFRQHSSLYTIAEANRFLTLGGYFPLNEDETAVFKATPRLIYPKTVIGSSPATDLTRLQSYLPGYLYQTIEPFSLDRWDETFLGHLKQLLRTVATYVPRHLALALLQRPLPPVEQVKGQFLEGTLLFADISGFTNLSEALREKGGKGGAEEIVRIINQYLDKMLEILFAHEGRLIKFGGDAMLCLFTGERQGAMNAIRAAWAMRQAMAEFNQIEAFQELFSLNMKVGNSSGLLFAATVGSEEHIEYFFSGSAVERTAQAESAALQGEIIVSADTYRQVKTLLQAEELPEITGYFRIKTLPAELKTTAKKTDSWQTVEALLADSQHDLWDVVDRLDALVPYLPVGLLPQLVYNESPGHMEGQHRQVTVLFANFVGMSDIIDHFGPEQAAEITAVIKEYFEAMQEEVHYFGGVINKVDLYDQGDKLMVIFGAPAAHERDARRAALTALKMRDAMTRLTSPVAAALLSQSIGIHSGFVFAGNVGSEINNRREYTVMGDTVNLAARLMSAADSGKILVSEAVWSQIQANFTAVALDPITVKGIRQPVPVYELQAERAGLQARRPSRALFSEIVGRENELHTLVELVNELLFENRKKIVAITGEGGVGKTRLVIEWQSQAADLIATDTPPMWLTGNGRSYGQRTHGIFLELLENLCSIEAADSPAAKWDKLSQQLRVSLYGSQPGWVNLFTARLAYLGHFLSFDLSLKRDLSKHINRLAAETLQLQTRLAVCDFLAYFARQRPLILLLEDLHWADDASLALLQFAIHQIRDDVPLLFCLIYRSRKDKRIWQTWQEISRDHPECRSIEVKELVGRVGRQLLLNLLDTEQPLDENFVALILTETDGNPLYVEETLHCLIEDGDLVQEDDGGWRLTQAVDRIHVPDSLYQIIQSRIDELDFGSPGARRVLWQAAILGASFTEESLFHLFATEGRGKQEFLGHTRELLKAAMIARSRVKAGDKEKPGFQFKHGLVQQVAYENMPVRKRRHYHREVGLWLEAMYQETLPAHYDLLAYHFEQGEEWERAFDYHWLAGQRDAAAYANENAAVHLRRALIAAARSTAVDDAQLAQIHYELGKALAVIGNSDDAHFQLDKAGQLLVVANAKTAFLQARIYYEKGRLYETTGGQENLAAALRLQHDGLQMMAKATTEPTTEAALLHILGGVAYTRLGNMAEAESKCRQCLAVAEATGDQSILSYAYRMLSVSARHQGRAAEAKTYIQNSIILDEALGDLISLGKDYSNQGVYAFEMGDWSLAETAYRQAADVLEQSGHQYQLAMTCCNLADLYYHLGNLEPGFAYGQRGLAIFQRLSSHQGIVFAHTVLATLHWRQNELENARIHLTQAREIVEEQGIHEFRPIVGRWLAQVYLSDGRYDLAETELDALLAQDENDLGLEFEPVQSLLGQLLAANGRNEVALKILQDSLQRLEQSEERYQAACANLTLAGVFANMAGNVEMARRYAGEARIIFVDLGARLDVERVDTLLARL